MTKIILFIYLLFFHRALALTPDLLELPNHPKYFSVFYKKYFDWFNHEFYNWKNFLNDEENEVVENSIASANHWLFESGDIKYSAFLIGVGSQEDDPNLFYTLEVKMPVSQKLTTRYNFSSLFKYERIKWNTSDNSICFGYKKEWECFDRANQSFMYSSSEETREVYRTDYFKYKILSDKIKESEFFYTNEFHILALPVNLRSTAIEHGTYALLPLDKIEKSVSGSYIIYYP